MIEFLSKLLISCLLAMMFLGMWQKPTWIRFLITSALWLGALSLVEYWDILQTVKAWQAEGIVAFNSWAVNVWQKWWTWNPYEVAVYCWSSTASWIQLLAGVLGIYGFWREGR